MDQKTPRLYSSAGLGIIDLEQRLEKKLNVVNSFSNSIIINKHVFTYFEDKNFISEKKYEKYRKNVN